MSQRLLSDADTATLVNVPYAMLLLLMSVVILLPHMDDILEIKVGNTALRLSGKVM